MQRSIDFKPVLTASNNFDFWDGATTEIICYTNLFGMAIITYHRGRLADKILYFLLNEGFLDVIHCHFRHLLYDLLQFESGETRQEIPACQLRKPIPPNHLCVIELRS